MCWVRCSFGFAGDPELVENLSPPSKGHRLRPLRVLKYQAWSKGRDGIAWLDRSLPPPGSGNLMLSGVVNNIATPAARVAHSNNITGARIKCGFMPQVKNQL